MAAFQVAQVQHGHCTQYVIKEVLTSPSQHEGHNFWNWRKLEQAKFATLERKSKGGVVLATIKLLDLDQPALPEVQEPDPILQISGRFHTCSLELRTQAQLL